MGMVQGPKFWGVKGDCPAVVAEVEMHLEQ